ncbi:hypothetical protein DFH07DRAFT_848339 [Mycena maculata]|uniref:Uncharacterized protein n=1 Tax=Mycena maculata TaxID=230809 RepID=A0AAD7HZ09_9AGAR|nr:hypothetical protein DFH07DRAFT_848339 [Mycena maculata]
MWHLAALFPGQSTSDIRLAAWPDFNRSTPSIVPATPYSASVVALLKSNILTAFLAAEIRLNFHALETDLVDNVQTAIERKSRAAQRDWDLLSAVCALLYPIATSGRPVQLLDPFPVYTIKTGGAYTAWRTQALAAVRDALRLIPHVEARFEEARLAITTEFLHACSSSGSSTLPYKAVQTLSQNLLPDLWVSSQVHVDNQRKFAAALRGLADSSELSPDYLLLLKGVITSDLFTEGLPWLSSDLQAVSTIMDVVQRYLASADAGTAQSQKLENILNWLELKELARVPDLGPLGQNDAGPSTPRFVRG